MGQINWTSAFIAMGPSFVITTRPGPIAINAEENLITHIIIKRAGPNYYVRKRVIISSAFIAINGPRPCSDYKAWAH